MFYGSFWMQKTMVKFISNSDLRKGQFQVKLGQNRPNLKIQHFVTKKTCLSYPVLSQNSKNVIYFCACQLEMSKTAFQKSDAIAFTCFFLALQSQKIKILF